MNPLPYYFIRILNMIDYKKIKKAIHLIKKYIRLNFKQLNMRNNLEQSYEKKS